MGEVGVHPIPSPRLLTQALLLSADAAFPQLTTDPGNNATCDAVYNWIRLRRYKQTKMSPAGLLPVQNLWQPTEVVGKLCILEYFALNIGTVAVRPDFASVGWLAPRLLCIFQTLLPKTDQIQTGPTLNHLPSIWIYSLNISAYLLLFIAK